MISYPQIQRALSPYVFSPGATGDRVILLCGPREAGKTFLAKEWLKKTQSQSLYFDWAQPAVRKRFETDIFPSPPSSLGTERWIVYDGLEKKRDGARILARTRDLYGDIYRLVVTVNHRAAFDSLTEFCPSGSVVRFEVMPLSLNEILGWTPARPILYHLERNTDLSDVEDSFSSIDLSSCTAITRDLLRFGPFPEPFLRQSEAFSKRWHGAYFERVLREEVRDLFQVSDLDRMRRVLSEIAEWVGKPLSMPAVGKAAHVAHPTVKAWLEVMECFYLIFAVTPWHRGVSRGLKKAVKWYFLDWCFAPEARRLQNVVASTLYRCCISLNDRCVGNYRLHYLRTLDKRGLQFLVVNEGRPVLAVEAAEDARNITKGIRGRTAWFQDRVLPAILVVDLPGYATRVCDDTWVLGIDRFLAALG